MVTLRMTLSACPLSAPNYPNLYILHHFSYLHNGCIVINYKFGLYVNGSKSQPADVKSHPWKGRGRDHATNFCICLSDTNSFISRNKAHKSEHRKRRNDRQTRQSQTDRETNRQTTLNGYETNRENMTKDRKSTKCKITYKHCIVLRLWHNYIKTVANNHC